MSDVYERRQQSQSQRRLYRDTARWLYSGVGALKVDQHAHVMPCEDGAFVEVVVWVPDTATSTLEHVRKIGS